MPKIVGMFLFKDSRKVGLGMWIVLLSSVFLSFGKIASTDWVGCLSMSALLVGGGTVLDAYIKKKPDAPPTDS